MVNTNWLWVCSVGLGVGFGDGLWVMAVGDGGLGRLGLIFCICGGFVDMG